MASRRLAALLGAGALCVGALACNDKGTAEGGTGDASSGTTAGAASSGGTTVAADDSTSGGEGASSGGSETTAAPPTEVVVGGTIEDYFAGLPIADAAISVYEMPGFETTSDARGLWEIPGLPVDTFGRFLVADTDFYWGAVVPFQTESDDIDDFELSQVSLDVIDIQIGVLQGQDPAVMVQDDTAVLLVALNQNSAAEMPPTVTLDPPPDPLSHYAPDASGQPTLGLDEIQWQLYPVAVFFNLTPGPEGTYTIDVTHPDRECTVEDPMPPTFARHINLIRVDCPPPA